VFLENLSAALLKLFSEFVSAVVPLSEKATVKSRI